MNKWKIALQLPRIFGFVRASKGVVVCGYCICNGHSALKGAQNHLHFYYIAYIHLIVKLLQFPEMQYLNFQSQSIIIKYHDYGRLLTLYRFLPFAVDVTR